MSNATSQTQMRVTRLTGALGAEVTGVDLRRSIPAETAEAVRNALDEHQVLVFTDHRGLTADRQVEIGRIFGFPGAAEPWRSFGETASHRAGAVTNVVRDANSVSESFNWHTDDPFAPSPPVVGMLYPEVIPSVGGDTAWVSLCSIYEGLSEPMQTMCESLRGQHSWELMRQDYVEPNGPAYVAKMEAAFPPAVHPLVYQHPRTGRKAIYLGGDRGVWMDRIIGLHQAEGQMLLDYLQRQLHQIDYQFRWHWSPGDFIIWDERTTNHKGTTDHMALDPVRSMRSVWVWPEDVDNHAPNLRSRAGGESDQV